jgi:hypothetical protein
LLSVLFCSAIVALADWADADGAAYFLLSLGCGGGVLCLTLLLLLWLIINSASTELCLLSVLYVRAVVAAADCAVAYGAAAYIVLGCGCCAVLFGSAIVALADCNDADGAAYMLGCACCLFCLAELLLLWLIVLVLNTLCWAVLFVCSVWQCYCCVG